jgi:PAS domain S-box-containing protein
LKAVEQLLSRDEICDLLVDGSHAIVRDVEGTILAWTAGAQRIYGWTREEAEGRTSHILLKTIFPAPLDVILVS